MDRPTDLSPRDAVDRWLDSISVERRQSTVETYRLRLKLFVEWAEEHDIESVTEITGWTIESYETHRRSLDLAPVTLSMEMNTLKNWLEYLARIELIDESIPGKVHIPDVARQDRSSDIRLTTDAASALITHYRSSRRNGTRGHVLLELAWYTGARAGGLCALDVQDVDLDDEYLMFQDRRSTETPLKNGLDGERPVGLPTEVCRAIDRYLTFERFDVRDDHGRQPLLASRVGRPTAGTIRDWMYLATIPCIHGPCPHDKDPETCQWTQYGHASKCPSSRAPHHVRTGAITWMLNCGMPVEVVAERVNASISVIEQHYDTETPLEEMELRRRPHLESLQLPDSTDE